MKSGGGVSIPSILWLRGLRPLGDGGSGERDLGLSIWRNHGGGLGRRVRLLLRWYTGSSVFWNMGQVLRNSERFLVTYYGHFAFIVEFGSRLLFARTAGKIFNHLVVVAIRIRNLLHTVKVPLRRRLCRRAGSWRRNTQTKMVAVPRPRPTFLLFGDGESEEFTSLLSIFFIVIYDEVLVRC